MTKFDNVMFIIFCKGCSESTCVKKIDQGYIGNVLVKAGFIFQDSIKVWLCPICLEEKQQIVDSNKEALDQFYVKKAGRNNNCKV